MTQAVEDNVTVTVLSGSALGPFDTVWGFEDDGEVTAWLRLGTGQDFTLLDPSDYTVTGTDTLAEGGEVELAGDILPGGGWAAGAGLALVRSTPLDQPATLGSSGGLEPALLAAMLDRAVRQTQDRAGEDRRAVKTPYGEGGLTLAPAASRAGMLLTFDEAGDLDTSKTYAALLTDVAGEVGSEAVALVNLAGAAQVGVVNAAGSAQVEVVGAAGSAQVGVIEAAADAKIAELALAPSVNVKAYASTAAGITAGDLFFAVPMAYSKAAKVYENVGGVATYRETVAWLGGYLYPAAIAQQRAFGAPENLLGRDGVFWFNCLDGWDSDKQRIPNALFPDNLSNNLLLLNSGYLGSVTNATVTVRHSTGPGGQQTAALLEYANGATVSFFGPIVLPADEYTFKYEAQNHLVGTVPLRHGKSNATTSYTSDNIDDTVWTVIDDVFTADGTSAYSYGIGNNSGSAQKVKVDRLQLVRTSDGAVMSFTDEPLDLSLRRNIRTPNSLNITPELLDVTATGQVYHAKMPTFPLFTEFAGMTLYFAMRSTGNTDNRALILAPGDASQPVHTSNGYNRFRFGPRYTTGQLRSYLELAAPGITFEAYADMEAYDDTLQIVVASFGASGVVFTVDGFLVGPYEQGQTLTSPMMEAYYKFFGGQNASQIPPVAETVMPVKFAMAGMEKKQITAGKARIMTDRMRRALASSGLKIVDSPTVTFTEGDSELHGNPRETNSTAAHMMRGAVSPTAWVVTMGLAGSVLGYPGDTNYLSMYARLPRLLENLTRAFNDGRSVRIVGQSGANDYARIISSGSGYASAILAYLGLIRAHWTSIGGDDADLIILWGDVLPRGNALGWNFAATFNPARAITNADLAAAVGGGIIDVLIPMGSHPIMGPDAAVDDPALYDPDKLHGTRPYGAGLILDSVVDVWEPTLV